MNVWVITDRRVDEIYAFSSEENAEKFMKAHKEGLYSFVRELRVDKGIEPHYYPLLFINHLDVYDEMGAKIRNIGVYGISQYDGVFAYQADCMSGDECVKSSPEKLTCNWGFEWLQQKLKDEKCGPGYF